MVVDVYLEFKYDAKTDEISITDTNLKRDKIDEVLGEYLRAQMGQGRDSRQPNRQETYGIKIGLDLDGDVFHTESDTGNAGLTTGLVMHLLKKRKDNPRYGLERRVSSQSEPRGGNWVPMCGGDDDVHVYQPDIYDDL